MVLADEFRIRAQRCLALAGAAPTLEAQTHWLSMAQLWLSLAQYSEEQELDFQHKAGVAMAAEQGERRPRSGSVSV